MELTKSRECPGCDGAGVVEEPLPGALRRARESTGKTMTAVARELGYSVPYMCDIELGRRRCTRRILEHYMALVPERP